MLLIDAETTRQLLPMRDCIEAMAEAMTACSAGRVNSPARTVLPLAGAGHFFSMPGAAARAGGGGLLYGAKLASLLPGNPAAGRPAVQGFVALFDGVTGAPAALVDGAEITRIRTAAASALATRALARADAESHGILGAGVQAASHLEAVAAVRDIRRVCVWARDSARAADFAARQSAARGVEVVAVREAAEAAACDIVSVATNASEPVLRGAWLRPGAHLNLVGAHQPDHREADSDAVAAAAVYADSRAAALREAGDLLIPLREGRIGPDHLRGEIGEVLLGQIPGRSDPAQITLYKSLGLVAQDLYAAGEVLRRALAEGAGTRTDFP